jgi:hypothetical protein
LESEEADAEILPSCAGLSRASTPFFITHYKTWMAGTSPAMNHLSFETGTSKIAVSHVRRVSPSVGNFQVSDGWASRPMSRKQHTGGDLFRPVFYDDLSCSVTMIRA